MSQFIYILLLFASFILGFLAARVLLAQKNSTPASGRVIYDAVQYKLSIGPNIVAIGGGTGLSTLLRGLKCFTKNITAVVTVTDEGGSSGRLRRELGVLPPGDIRNCIVALAENDNALNNLLNFRFNKGELNGHNLGNLILVAATEIMGDFQKAVQTLNNLLAIRGRVLPVTTNNVALHGETISGKRLEGELEISENGSELAKIWLEPCNAEAVPAVKDAIKNADIIILGPGSLFTSIMPNLLLKDVAELLKNSDKPIVYIANLMTQPKETSGMNIMAHIDWIASVIGSAPDYILANQQVIPSEFVSRYAKIGAEPLYLSEAEDKCLASLGASVIYGDFCEIFNGKYLRHNAAHISEKIMQIIHSRKKV